MIYGSSFAAARVETRSLMAHVVQATVELPWSMAVHVDFVLEAEHYVRGDEAAVVL